MSDTKDRRGGAVGKVIVVFEFTPAEEGRNRYFDLVEKLKPLLAGLDGFIGGERFQSLSDKGKLVSINVWESEKAAIKWRNHTAHRLAQLEGKEKLLRSYKITVAEIIREYSGGDGE